MAPLVTASQFQAPSILGAIQTGLTSRGELQRQDIVTQDQANKLRLEALAEESAARNLATQQQALGVSATPSTDPATGKINESQEIAQRRMIAENPEVAKKILAEVEVHTQQGLEALAKFTHTMRGKSPEEQAILVGERIAKIEDRGGNAAQTKRLLMTDANGEPIISTTGTFTMSPNLTPKQVESAMINANEAALTAWQRAQLEERKREATTKASTAAAKLKGAGSIVQSAEILPNGDAILVMKDGTTKVETLKETSKRQVKTARTYGASVQGLRSGERESGKGAIQIGHTAFNKLAPIRKNIGNLRQAVQLLEEGASTGPVMKMLPTFRASTVELKNLQSQLGLDIIGDVTFGALSESELAFALDTGIPEGLAEPELKQWLLRKANSQSKLYDAYEAAALYLGTPGNDVPGYVRKRQSERLEESKVQGRPVVGELIQGRPEVGTIDAGFRYKGGDPSQQSNWEEVR